MLLRPGSGASDVEASGVVELRPRSGGWPGGTERPGRGLRCRGRRRPRPVGLLCRRGGPRELMAPLLMAAVDTCCWSDQLRVPSRGPHVRRVAPHSASSRRPGPRLPPRRTVARPSSSGGDDLGRDEDSAPSAKNTRVIANPGIAGLGALAGGRGAGHALRAATTNTSGRTTKRVAGRQGTTRPRGAPAQGAGPSSTSRTEGGAARRSAAPRDPWLSALAAAGAAGARASGTGAGTAVAGVPSAVVAVARLSTADAGTA